MRAIHKYEAKYVNATGYWAAFQAAALDLREEAVSQNKVEDVMRFDVCCVIAKRYILRVLGFRTEFYRMAADDPSYAKMILPVLEKRGEMPLADDLDEPMQKREGHMMIQMMKAVATLSASNETKTAQGSGKGGAANGK